MTMACPLTLCQRECLSPPFAILVMSLITNQESCFNKTFRYQPSVKPTDYLTEDPTIKPTANPTISHNPSHWPSSSPTSSLPPTFDTTSYPSASPTNNPTVSPVSPPTLAPTAAKTFRPTSEKPTVRPSVVTITEKATIEETQACPQNFDSMREIDSSASFFFVIVPSNPSGSGNGLLCGRLEVESDGWIGFAISDDGKMSGSQAIVGIAKVESVLKYELHEYGATVMSEGSQSLLNTSIYTEDGKTIMKFTKLLVEDGEIPILEDQVNSFLFARGDGNDLGYHSSRISFKIDFGPSTYTPTMSKG